MINSQAQHAPFQDITQNTIMQRMLYSSLLASLSSIASAQSTAQSAASCAGITDNEQRLACYDKLFRKTSPEQSDPTVTSAAHTATPSQAPPEPSSAAASVSEFGAAYKQPKNNVKHLTAVVTGVAPIGRGLYRLTLNNGQVWDTTQADWALDFQTNNTVTISRMMLGNYLISRPGQGHTVAVKRVQ
jgi:hypothetical protein